MVKGKMSSWDMFRDTKKNSSCFMDLYNKNEWVRKYHLLKVQCRALQVLLIMNNIDTTISVFKGNEDNKNTNPIWLSASISDIMDHLEKTDILGVEVSKKGCTYYTECFNGNIFTDVSDEEQLKDNELMERVTVMGMMPIEIGKEN